MPDSTIEGLASAPLPMPGARITSPAGVRPRGGGRTEWHEGADFVVATGTPVLATRAGVVHAALPEHTRGIRGYGNFVILWHPQDRLYTGYAHLSEMFVERGELVGPGTVIAASGRSSGGKWPGLGPHLHFAVRRPRPDGRAPWPGAYPHPERAPWAHRAYWVDPVEYLRDLGLEPASPRGAGELRVVFGSAADAGEGLPVRPTCPARSIVMAGGRLPEQERPLVVAPPAGPTPPAGPSAAAPSSDPSPHAPSPVGATSRSSDSPCWPWAMLVGGAAFAAAALAAGGPR